MADVVAEIKVALALFDTREVVGSNWQAARVTWDQVRALVARVEQAEQNAAAWELTAASNREDAERLAEYARTWEDRAKTAEAAYQEAQLTIAGLEAERDHSRSAFVRTQANLCRVRQALAEMTLKREWCCYCGKLLSEKRYKEAGDAHAVVRPKEAEAMGYLAGRDGATTTNCDFRLFASPDLTRAWERGYARGQADAREAHDE